MKGHRHLGFVAAGATLLAAAPLSAIFDKWTWLVQSFVTVALVVGAATLARSARAPVWGQLLAMLGALLLALTWLFPSGGELLAVLPTPDTIAHFGRLLTDSVTEARTHGVPVPDSKPLLFLAVLGVGGVAVGVDLLSVGLRRPALTGLPMLAIYSVPVAVYVDNVPALPFMIGAIGYLWLLAADNIDRVRQFGRRFTGDGRNVGSWEPSSLAATGRRLAVVGVVLAVLLPLAAPGMTNGFLTRFTAGGEGVGRSGQGGPGRMNLFAALSGELNRNEVRDLVRVRTTEESPYYLRFAVADELTVEGFGTRKPSGRPVTRPLPDPREGSWRAVDVTYRQYRAEVEITNDFNMPFLPVYASPVRTADLDASWMYDPNLTIVFSNRSTSKGKRYSFEYVRADYTPELLAKADPLPAQHTIRRLFTPVPERIPEVDELVGRLIAGERTEYAKVRAIYDYFSRDNGFTYSLRTEGGTSGRDIVDFLTNKAGFCQQYASAMAWLVRAAGIPARVAFGFTNGSNRSGGAYTLTNLNLHAWTEVYFDGFGWVPFDATPAASVPGSARSVWAPDVDAPDPVVPSATPSGGPAPAGSSDPTDRDQVNRDVDEELGLGAGTTPTDRPTWPWWTAAGVLALLALLALPALRRILLRRRRQLFATGGTAPALAASATDDVDTSPGAVRVLPSGADEERARREAHAAWEELLDTLMDYRIEVNPAETPRATVNRLLADGVLAEQPAGDSQGAEGARLLGQAEERARYARHPLPSGQLGPALVAVRRAIAAGASRRTRFIATVLPPSVVVRWRLAVLEASTDLVNRAGRLGERLHRWNPVRLLRRMGPARGARA